MKTFNKSLLIIGIISSCNAGAKTYNLPYDMKFDISGYLGWRQIFSNRQFDSVPSQPEIGLTTSLKLTDTINIFNQFRYGTDIDNILVYNQINYTPKIPIDDFSLTLRGGKMWYDWGLYGKTRVNPRTRQGVFQPQSIYWNTLDATITSGIGVGFDAKYKNFTLSYIIDDPTFVNANKTAGAWVTVGATNYSSKFAGHQSVSMSYEIPEYGLRAIAHWTAFQFNFDLASANLRHSYANPQNAGVGIEWTYKDLTLSVEGMCTKKPGFSWTNTSELYCGISPSAEYDINDNFTIRANYNQYSTPTYSSIQSQNFTRDLNLGINWHSGSWLANVEGHYIRGGRLVDPSNLQSNPNGYESFYVVGMNLVYFFD